ncbi:hypothetical protein AXK57_18150 [Tsukamurella pulmonis]|nr:hypothetical protein [Tsukamurella pulmonis]KXO94424.1 hypothetical protein AXK56_17360 [Tsukamurella pulmonis]KXP12240.1 hypothetical protein AXK57_18150 [Tsukamurella pulmonis]RDH10411.1 hypothetical protein DVB88_17940 [Tsukamurella pulmonis]
MRSRIMLVAIVGMAALGTVACDPFAAPGPGEQVNVLDEESERSDAMWRAASHAGLALPAGARTVAAAVESRGLVSSTSYIHAVIRSSELAVFLRDSDLTMTGFPADSLTLRPWYADGVNGEFVLTGPAYRLIKGTRGGLNYGESLKVYLRTGAGTADVYYSVWN